MGIPQDGGIEEKLKRAKENIQNLGREVDTFLDEGRYGLTISDSDPTLAEEAIGYHLARKVPPRFSVLAGEALYNLRSCLDHVACILHLANNGRDCERTEFPIYVDDPRSNPNELRKYIRKIKRFRKVSPRTRTLIHRLQPYQPGNRGPNNYLAILHQLNNIDKHRELVVLGATTYQSQTFQMIDNPGQVSRVYYRTAEFADSEVRPPHAVKVDGKHVFQVAISEVGFPKRDEPLLPLLDAIRRRVATVLGEVTAGY